MQNVLSDNAEIQVNLRHLRDRMTEEDMDVLIRNFNTAVIHGTDAAIQVMNHPSFLEEITTTYNRGVQMGIFDTGVSQNTVANLSKVIAGMIIKTRPSPEQLFQEIKGAIFPH